MHGVVDYKYITVDEYILKYPYLFNFIISQKLLCLKFTLLCHE